MNKILVWGAMPNEQDGGAVVTFYQFKEIYKTNPQFQIHAIPKVWQQANPSLLPFVKFHRVKTRFLGDIPDKIPQIMKKYNIPYLVLWHIPWEYFPIIDKVHKIGGKVLNWQTIHWPNDMLFLSDRLQDFDWWVPPTEYAKETLVREANLDANKMTVIPHGVDTQSYYPHETRFWDKKLKTILFVGRCQFTKGIVPLMLTARKLVSEFNCRLVFKAGIHDGIYKSKEIGHILHKMSRWDSRIVFISQWTSHYYNEELIASSDILVCPSGHEGFSLPPLEAMVCKKAVAVTDIPVHRELLGGKNGECGLLMPPTMPTEYVNDTQMVKVPSSDMIYGTLKYLLENPDEAEVMAEKGFNRAVEYYSLSKVCKQWLELMERL